ncbi:hypothetical protein BURPS1655_A2064 [Burkholderia pseudomallei 1655]|nr:hypothetical protein BURPS1655_A2064 [Burkholderia pseudomallei 1655]
MAARRRAASRSLACVSRQFHETATKTASPPAHASGIRKTRRRAAARPPASAAPRVSNRPFHSIHQAELIHD